MAAGEELQSRTGRKAGSICGVAGHRSTQWPCSSLACIRLPDRGEARRRPDRKEHLACKPAYQGHSGAGRQQQLLQSWGWQQLWGHSTRKQGQKLLIPIAGKFPRISEIPQSYLLKGQMSPCISHYTIGLGGVVLSTRQDLAS